MNILLVFFALARVVLSFHLKTHNIHDHLNFTHDDPETDEYSIEMAKVCIIVTIAISFIGACAFIIFCIKDKKVDEEQLT